MKRISGIRRVWSKNIEHDKLANNRRPLAYTADRRHNALNTVDILKHSTIFGSIDGHDDGSSLIGRDNLND